MQANYYTPQPVQQVSPQAEQLFNYALTLATQPVGSDLELAAEGPNYKVYKKQLTDGQMLIRASASFPDIPVEDLAFMIFNDQFRAEYDNVFCNPQSIQRIDQNTDIYYFQIDPPVPMVSKRDGVVQRTTFRGHRGIPYLVHMQSVEYPPLPPVDGIVRAHVHNQTRVITPGQNGLGSQMHMINHVDIGGSIPTFAINMMASKGPLRSFDTIAKNYQQWKDQGKIGRGIGY